jgi:ABC-type lipoprotein export system ATPase subunit
MENGSRQRTPLVAAIALHHTYGTGEERVAVLRRVHLELTPGERVAVMGRSGSGKTTLLELLAAHRTPTGGHLVIAGHDLGRLGRREREAFRRAVVGYVWQQPEDGLLAGLTALENVLVPALGRRRSGSEQVAAAVRLLEAMRLGDRRLDRPAQLSPLETQRLALAVALANRPQLLLADELTARLDWTVARELLDDLGSLLDQLGTAAVLVTHDARLAGHVDRVLAIHDGVVVPAREEPAATSGRARR